MAEGKTSKRGDRVLAIAIGLAALVMAVYAGYTNIPRHVSGLCPEIRQAELCSVLYMDEDLKSTSVIIEGEELETLIGALDRLSLYSLLGRRGSGGSVILKGDTDWSFYFRINGENAKVSITVTDQGEVSVGNRVFKAETEDFMSLLEGILTE